MFSFLYIFLAFAVQPSFSLVHRKEHQNHGHWHHHHSHNTSVSASSVQTRQISGISSSILYTTSAEPAMTSSSEPSTSLSTSVTTIATSTSATESSSTSPPTFSTETRTVVPLSSPISTTTSLPSTATTTASSAVATSSGSYWQPAPDSTWQIQLSTPVTNFSSPFSIIDLDLFDNPASTISALHSSGSKAICYFSAGTYENWRPDASSFLPSDLGSAVDGWAGEWWVDTNSDNVRSIMTARIELAASKGCDGLDPDNVDGYDNSNGLGLTQADAVSYLTFLADVAHSRGLSIGLKNAGDIVGDVLPSMEWQVNEQCIEYNECDLFTPFVEAGKPVFHIEYPSDAPDVSTQVKVASCEAPTGFSSVLKMMDLDAWIDTC